MRIVAHIAPTATGWSIALSDPDDAAWQPASRALDASADAEFPLPPASELAADLAALRVAPGAAADKLRLLRLNCLAGYPPRGEAALFGRYLHASLFGDQWAAIEARVGSQPIELGLEIAPAGSPFAALPWELMHTSDGLPLAANPKRHVAIVRLVQANASPNIEPLELPLRVLFVVGRQLDTALRPGAEYLGLLRRLGVSSGGDARINLRLLTEATTDEIESAARDFHPHVVHFICHGELDPLHGARLLLTKRERDDPASAKTNASDPCGGARLLALLAQPRLPCVAVLNACHGADGVATAAGQSLGAQLVAGGIPVALGMAGAVADGACRLFTRGFYEALLAGASLPLAAARARRSAMLHYGNYDANVEWSRLTLFARDWAATQFAPPSAPSTAARVAAAAAKLLPLHGRLLCDRFAGVRAYETFRSDVAAGRGKRVLAIGVVAKCEEPTDQFSKTMLLDTIGVQAALDGFVPCKLGGDGKDPPANLIEFALDLAIEIDAARKRFGVAAAASSPSMQLALVAAQHQLPAAGAPAFLIEMSLIELRKKIRALHPDHAALDPKVVRAALVEDFKSLQADTNAALGATRRALVLIDDLHRFEGVAEPLLEQLIDSDGLVHDGVFPVPVAFTYSQHDKTGAETSVARTVRNFLKAKAELVVPVELRPIESAEEQRLAYSQFLLTRKPPLAINTEHALRDHADFFFEIACGMIRGVPSRFDHKDLNIPVEKSLTRKVLLEADDEQILAKFP
jgi:hypothetical protein